MLNGSDVCQSTTEVLNAKEDPSGKMSLNWVISETEGKKAGTNLGGFSTHPKIRRGALIQQNNFKERVPFQPQLQQGNSRNHPPVSQG
jgi:hypothetical protein